MNQNQNQDQELRISGRLKGIYGKMKENESEVTFKENESGFVVTGEIDGNEYSICFVTNRSTSSNASFLENGVNNSIELYKGEERMAKEVVKSTRSVNSFYKLVKKQQGSKEVKTNLVVEEGHQDELTSLLSD
jgi:hypothetical protein